MNSAGCLLGDLAARVVNGILPCADQLGDGDQLIALGLQAGDYGFQRFRRIFGTIVQEYNGAVEQVL